MSHVSPPENSRKINAVLVLGVAFAVGGLTLSLALAVFLGVDSQSLKRYFNIQSDEESCHDNGLLMPTWPGEYPYPAVNLSENTELQGVIDICKMTQSESCMVPAGLYHPWAESDSQYASIVPAAIYRTLEPVRGKLKRHEAGSELTILAYKTAGICRVGIEDDIWEMTCPNPILAKWLQPLESEEINPRQFFMANCMDGVKRWIEVDEPLFEHGAVSKGTIGSHGTVGSGEFQ